MSRRRKDLRHARDRETKVSPPSVRSWDGWLAFHARWVLLILVVAAASVRLIYFRQLDSGPSIELHRWDQVDMHYYDAWGRQIAQGDWLSRSVGVPMQEWHHRVAAEYFAGHPDVKAALIEQASGAIKRTLDGPATEG